MAIRTGGPGNDTLTGTSDSDILRGHGGDDALVALDGDDILLGGSGGDFLDGGPGSDILAGGGGRDRASWYLQPATTINLVNHTAANSEGIDILQGVEEVSATLYDDTIVGDEGDNWIHGDYGHDTMSGGGGSDDFYYSDRHDFGDVIADFQSSADRLVMHRTEVWPEGAPPSGPADPATFVVGTAPQDGTDYWILDSGSGTLYWDGDGTGPWAAIEVARFTGGVPDAGDIYLA